MPGGNADDPFCRNGIDWSGNRGEGGFGPSDLGDIDAAANRRGRRKEYGIGDEQTVVDKPLVSSDRRSKRGSSDETYPMNSYPYGGPNSRQSE